MRMDESGTCRGGVPTQNKSIVRTQMNPRARALLVTGRRAVFAEAALEYRAYPMTEGTMMGFITTQDGTDIFYKDWGSGRPVVLSHGWPLNSDSWESQQMFFANNGYRDRP